MESFNFTELAPRHGTRPIMAGYADIGFSGMSGGAFNWGNLWSGIKSFGSSIKNWGNKMWNSSTGQRLRDKLKETDAQQKLVDGIAAGIHGAIDLANQEVAKQVQKRLDKPLVEPGLAPPTAQVEEVEKEEVKKEPVVVVDPPPRKRPQEVDVPSRKRLPEEEIVTVVEEPPSYESLFPNNSAAPMTRPIAPMAKPVLRPSQPVHRPVTLEEPPLIAAPPLSTLNEFPRNRGWQGTLNSIVGLGVQSCKRKRCY